MLSKRASDNMIRDITIRRNEDYGDYAERMRQRAQKDEVLESPEELNEELNENFDGLNEELNEEPNESSDGFEKFELDDLDINSLEDEED